MRTRLLFSERARRILESAGWTDERRVETGKYKSGLASQGLEVFPAANEFLSRFGGLVVPYHLGGREDLLDFTLDEFIGPGYPVWPIWCKTDATKTGVSLTPLGVADEGFAYVGIDAAGRFYVRFQNFMVMIGDHWVDGLDTYLTGEWEENFTKVPFK